MKFHYAGKYSGNPDDIPCLEHEPGAVQFKQAKDPKQFSGIMSIISVAIIFFFFILSCIRARDAVRGGPGEDEQRVFHIQLPAPEYSAWIYPSCHFLDQSKTPCAGNTGHIWHSVCCRRFL